MRKCLLNENKACDACMECDRCDLDPEKLCDNCCKCIEREEAYISIPVSDVVTEHAEEYLKAYFEEELSEE